MGLEVSERHPRTAGEGRRYITGWAQAVGLDYSTYKSGGVRSATLHGQHISNGKAGRILTRQWWLTDAGMLRTDPRADDVLDEEAATVALMDALIDAGLVPYVDPLIAAQDEVIRAEDALTQAREVRGVLIAEQVKAGRSKYSIAQAIGISSQAVTEAVRRYSAPDPAEVRG